MTPAPRACGAGRSLTELTRRLGAFLHPQDREARVEEMLTRFPRLRERQDQLSGTLSGGEQQMLAIARALMSEPRLLLLDEPSLGLSPKIVKEVFALIKEINALRKIAIFVVEHSIKSVLGIADRAYVLSHGKVVIQTQKGETLADDALEKVFLL